MNLQLHIDQLALDGLALAPHQGVLVQDAVERELTRLLTRIEPAQWNTGVALASVPGGPVHVAPNADATGLGNQIATAVHSGLEGSI